MSESFRRFEILLPRQFNDGENRVDLTTKQVMGGLMPVLQPLYGKEEFARRGQEVYERVPVDRFRVVDPGELRLAPGRQDGPDKARYLSQVRRFGAGTIGFPPIEVTEGRDGELMINNGVTRATRIHFLAAGQLCRLK